MFVSVVLLFDGDVMLIVVLCYTCRFLFVAVVATVVVIVGAISIVLRANMLSRALDTKRCYKH